MNNNFKDNLKSNINLPNKDNNEIPNTNTKNEDIESNPPVFKLKKKVDDKTGKKPVQIYFEQNLIKRIDDARKKTNYSRNELVTLMVEFCLDHMEIEK